MNPDYTTSGYNLEIKYLKALNIKNKTKEAQLHIYSKLGCLKE